MTKRRFIAVGVGGLFPLIGLAVLAVGAAVEAAAHHVRRR